MIDDENDIKVMIGYDFIVVVVPFYFQSSVVVEVDDEQVGLNPTYTLYFLDYSSTVRVRDKATQYIL